MDYIKYIIIGAVVLILVGLVSWFIKTANNFVVMKNRIKDQEAQVDVQLKRRYDLIPNLVETVKGCASFEKETMEAVISARTGAMQAQTMEESAECNSILDSALHRLMAVSESYPELKASANFSMLQKELSETEDKIAVSRQFYNDTVLKYNNAVAVFPQSVVASITGHKEAEYFKAAAAEKKNVEVKF